MILVLIPLLGCTLVLFLAGNAALVIGFMTKSIQEMGSRNQQAVAFFMATLAWLAVTTFVALGLNLFNLR